MADQFFGELGKSISRATHSAMDRTSVFIESAKISAQISSEQKEVEKLQQSIGAKLMQKIKDGSFVPEDDLRLIADEIFVHEEQIGSLKANLAKVKGMKVCPSCGEVIAADVAFCPKCGASAPVKAPEAAEDIPAEEVCEAEEEVQMTAEEACACAEELSDAVKDAAENVGEVFEGAEEAAEQAFEKAEEVINGSQE